MLLGLSGLLNATFPLAFAYIADHVPPDGRASPTVWPLALVSVVRTLWALRSERCSTTCTVAAPSFVVLAILIFNALFTLVFMQESAPPPPPSRAELMRRANPFGARMLRTSKAMVSAVGLCTSPFPRSPSLPPLPCSFSRLLSSSHPRSQRLLSAIVLFFDLPLWGFLSNKGVYSRRRFGQSVSVTAAQLALFGLVSAVSQSVGLPFARRYMSEPAIARACFLCAVLAQLIYAFATDLWVLYPAMALLGVSVGGFATVSSLCSQVVPHSLVGEAQGVLASVKALMEGVGPLAFAWMLPRFEGTPMPGAPWLASAGLMGVAYTLCWWLEVYTDDAVACQLALRSGGVSPPDHAVSDQASDAEHAAVGETCPILRRGCCGSSGTGGGGSSHARVSSAALKGDASETESAALRKPHPEP